MAILDKDDWGDGLTRFVFFCPGCRCGHWFKTDGPGPVWEFNGDARSPTVRASILVIGMAGAGGKRGVTRCHSFITDGRIQFLADCEHGLAGQTVALPDWAAL